MDQIQIGRFIAKTRKSLHLTQRQLADALSISDKTISKWETGKGLPEISLLLPLCHMLNISVNELLSAEKILPADYHKKAEENMANLMEKNRAENKKTMALSIICGAISIIAVCALVALASFLKLPAFARTLLIVAALLIAIVGIGAAAMLEIRAGYFECPHCKALFVPTMAQYIKGCHTLKKRWLTCPRCGKAGMCKHRIAK